MQQAGHMEDYNLSKTFLFNELVTGQQRRGPIEEIQGILEINPQLLWFHPLSVWQQTTNNTTWR